MPPVRLFRAGEEVSDVWDLLRTNVRMAAGRSRWTCGRSSPAGTSRRRRWPSSPTTMGMDFFLQGMTALQDLSERELRKRIAAMPDGTYRSEAWTDWDDELYHVPCTLTIEGDHMVFDFEGASPQAPHFFNSQPYIIKSAMVMQLRAFLVAGSAVHRGPARADRDALPRRHHRERGAAGTDERRAHARWLRSRRR